MKDGNRNDPVYKAFRAAVFKRDGYHCKMPGCLVKGLLRICCIKGTTLSPDNGVTLCAKCLYKVKAHPEQYEATLQNIANPGLGDVVLELLAKRYQNKKSGNES
jgi:hypothetical protein